MENKTYKTTIKPKFIEVEFIQFNRKNYDECNSFTGNNLNRLTIERRLNGNCYCYFFNGSGDTIVVHENDYIVKYNDGSIEVVSKDLFESKYNL